MDLLALDNFICIYEHLLLLHMNKIIYTLHATQAPVRIAGIVGSISYLLLLETTTSVTLEIADQDGTLQPITLMTLSGMRKDVTPSVLVASLILLHGSRQHYQRLPVMTLSYVSTVMKQTTMRIL